MDACLSVLNTLDHGGGADYTRLESTVVANDGETFLYYSGAAVSVYYGAALRRARPSRSAALLAEQR
jgi:hypothetical protein